MKVSVAKCNNIQHPFPIFAWLIKLFQRMLPWQKDSWSHMAMKFEDKDGNVFFVDANSKGTMKRNPDNFYEQYSILESHQLEKEVSFVEFSEWYKKLDGKSYDWKQILGMLLKCVLFLKFNKIGHNYNKLICCELIINYFEHFNDLEVMDPDNFDLLMTWNIAKGL